MIITNGDNYDLICPTCGTKYNLSKTEKELSYFFASCQKCGSILAVSLPGEEDDEAGETVYEHILDTLCCDEAVFSVEELANFLCYCTGSKYKKYWLEYLNTDYDELMFLKNESDASDFEDFDNYDDDEQDG